jgi:hypothetical protein
MSTKEIMQTIKAQTKEIMQTIKDHGPPVTIAFLLSLTPPLLYVAALWKASDGVPSSLWKGVLIPLGMSFCIGWASFRMHGLRQNGIIATVRRHRKERLERFKPVERDEAQPSKNDREKEKYETDLRHKLGATLVTLTALGSISFLMVVFALDTWHQHETVVPRDRVAFTFVVFLLVATSVLLLASIESYDTALDPVWNISQIDQIRGFTVWTYSLALCMLVYTVAFAAFIVRPLLGLFTTGLFAALVHLYDKTDVTDVPLEDDGNRPQ